MTDPDQERGLARQTEAQRKPGLAKLLAPVALAAALILGINLVWNLHKAEPVAEMPAAGTLEKAAPATATATATAPVEAREPEQDPPRAGKAPTGNKVAADAAAPPPIAAQRSRKTRSPAAADALAQAVPAPEPAPPPPPAPVLSESQKIDHLIAYIGGLQGAVFIRNGSEHTPDEAVSHLQMKRDKAGDRVKTADDFIRLCASKSYLSGKPYQIRFADGRTLTSEEVLRAELARIQ
jgi:hypothetical protein